MMPSKFNPNPYHQSIHNSLHASVLVVDRNYRIVDANDSYLRGRILQRDERVGRFCYEACHFQSEPCHKSGIDCPVKTVFESRVPQKVIHRHRGPGGKALWEEVLAAPLTGDGEEVKYVVEEIRDITELLNTKKVVRMLKSQLKALQEIVPICAVCKQVKNEEGHWRTIEEYLKEQPGQALSHGLCPDCVKKHYADLYS